MSIFLKTIESKVALKIPIMTAPFTLKWARVVITIKPNKATIAEHARPPNFHSSGLLKSTSSTKVNLLLISIFEEPPITLKEGSIIKK